MRGVGRQLPGGGKVLLEGIDLTVGRGGITSLVGPSGAGKSTLLRLVNRLDEAGTGSIAVLGRALADWPVRELRRKAAMVFQEPSLLGLTVRENLALPFRLGNGLPEDFASRVAWALERAELPSELLERDAGALSVGQRQRAALARSLISGPELLLLDEPTAGLDMRTAERLLDGLVALNREEGLTLILATHRLEEVRQIGGRLAVLMDGRLEGEGETDGLLKHPPNAAVADFLTRSHD
jgi:ABC-type methionine transport system ATPase subunit